MKIFEFHFNPLQPSDLISGQAKSIFNSFCFEPKNIYEKRLGSLYMAGELRNVLPQNFRLLNKIAQTIKENYYSAPPAKPEKSLEESLKKANSFLAKEVSKENVSWLGNLNFAALSVKGGRKLFPDSGFTLNLSKVGSIKTLLLRAGRITDIGKNLDFEEMEPYPLKVFTSAISGRIAPGDKILMVSQETYDFFSKQGILNDFAKTESFDEQTTKSILKPVESQLSEISGILLLIDFTEGDFARPKSLTYKKEPKEFSLKDVFSPFAKTFKKIPEKMLSAKTIFKLSDAFRLPKIKKKLPAAARSKLSLKAKIASKPKKVKKTPFSLKFPLKRLNPSENLKRNLFLVFSFIILLALGFFIFQIEEGQQAKRNEKIMEEVKEKISRAESLSASENDQEAISILQDALEEIIPLAQKIGFLKNQAFSLKNSIEEHLKNLSKLENIADPKIAFELDPQELVPEKIIYSNGNLYSFSPLSDNLLEINLRDKNKNSYSFNFEKSGQASLAAVFNNSISFFSSPNQLAFLKNGRFNDPLFLKSPYSDFDFVSFLAYQDNFYFLDSKNDEIIKYPSPISRGKDFPQFWLDPKTKKATDAKSVAIDGSIWVLKEDNTISRYYNGQHKDDLSVNVFPSPKRLYKIFTSFSLPYLYLLEPVQNRVIILDKNGRIYKQFQSEKFENLKDIAVSDSGQTIYLLNNQLIYEVNL